MKPLLVIMLATLLLAGNALATKVDPREAPGIRPAWSPDKSSILESFEGAFPPAGWTAVVALPTNTWQQTSLSSYAGATSAYVHWQEFSWQNESLSFSAPVAAGEDLFFATMGSKYWSAWADFTVEINTIPVYSFHGSSATSWVWSYPQIDLQAWEGTSPVITFRYRGYNGADHFLDAIQIGTGSPLPPASFCPSVIQATGTSFAGDTCDGRLMIISLPCAAYAVMGFEHFYEIFVPSNCQFTAHVTAATDGVLWLLDSCEAPGAAYNCLAFADDGLTAGAPETLTWTNTTGAARSVFLVIDGYGDGVCGPYTFEFTSDCAVATESENFGSLKAMFR
jgi:hypothetical protein